MGWRDEFRSLRWVVVVDYPDSERRAVGPFDNYADAANWVTDNRSELWLGYQFIPLEEIHPSRIFSSGEDTEDSIKTQW